MRQRSNHTEITKVHSVQGVQQRLGIKLHRSESVDTAPFDAQLPHIGLRTSCEQLPDQLASEDMFDLMEIRGQPAFWLSGGDTFPDEAQLPHTNGDTKFLSQFSLEGDWKRFAVCLTAAR
jgi:hypothetical protein